MKTTISKFWAEYNRNMVRTKFLSQLGAFLIAILALVEIGQYWVMLYQDFPLDAEMIGFAAKITIFHSMVAGAFGVRFLLLFKRSSIKLRWVVGSWLLAVFVAVLYYADSQDYWDPTAIEVYATQRDPLEVVWITFLIWSAIRFVITSLVSYIRIR